MTAVPARSLALFSGANRGLSAVRGVSRKECHKRGAPTVVLVIFVQTLRLRCA